MAVQDLDPTYDPNLDLVLEREVDVPPEFLWKAWTTPEYLKQWFTPAPWTIDEAEVDARPGGVFSTTMVSPDGERFPNEGCVLQAVEGERFVFTSTLSAGFRPTVPTNSAQDLPFTAIIVMEPTAKGCRYTAIAKHPDSTVRKSHEEMGFHEGWGTVLDQLVELGHREKVGS
jgi:uncharacterized protein YndB with AHSA1/START domain